MPPSRLPSLRPFFPPSSLPSTILPTCEICALNPCQCIPRGDPPQRGGPPSLPPSLGRWARSVEGESESGRLRETEKEFNVKMTRPGRYSLLLPSFLTSSAGRAATATSFLALLHGLGRLGGETDGWKEERKREGYANGGWLTEEGKGAKRRVLPTSEPCPSSPPSLAFAPPYFDGQAPL